MARLSLTVFAFLAMLCIAFAQSSSSSSGDVAAGSSSSGAASSTGLTESSTSIAASSTILVDSSSSGVHVGDSSSGMILDSSSAMELVSSSSAMEDMSSSAMDMTSSSSFNPLPFVPVNWGDLDIAGNNSVFNITWGNKTENNLMFGIGSTDGFIIDDVSGKTLRLVEGFTYSFMLDSAAAAQGFYVTFDPQGNEIAGSNISFVGVPKTTPGTYNFTLSIPSSEEHIFVYYASNVNQYAGGAIIIGRQSAAALQASFVVMAVSAFVALLFPKW